MSKYEKPMVMVNEELAEGVYAASGCHTASSYFHQTPVNGDNRYMIQVDASHIESTHTSNSQTVTITLNHEVMYNGQMTNVIEFEHFSHQNGTTDIGFGNVELFYEGDDLEILDTCVNCNHAEHN